MFLSILISSLCFVTQDVAPPRRCPAVQEILTRISADRVMDAVERLAGFGSRHPLSGTESPSRGVGAARHYLRAEFEQAAAGSEGRLEVLDRPFERTAGRRQQRTLHYANIIARLHGANPDRGAWVFGGHYDSRNDDAFDGKGDAPGADDDASGVAVVLELARVLASVEFEADVYLCAFDGEELGLFGSEALAADLEQEGRVVEGMVALDTVGSSTGPDGTRHPGVIRCFSRGFDPERTNVPLMQRFGAETEGVSRQLARYLALLADRYLADLDVKLVYRNDRFGRGGDHSSFIKRGWPGVRLTEAAENYDHQHQRVHEENGVRYGDLAEFVDAEYLARVTRLAAVVALNGAGAPPPPARVAVSGAVRHHTTVRWSAVEDPALAGYRIWLRETSAPTWQRAVFVPAGQIERSIEYLSIDDYFFAVSSIDSDGRESPPRFPSPRPRR